jgi:L-rhamnose mutarotase
MQRIAFALPIKPDRVDAYRRTHAAVWEELQAENRRAGIRTFSVFLFGHHAIGYLECDDWARASAYLDQSEVQARWQAKHADILDVDTASGLVPLQILEEVFHQD